MRKQMNIFDRLIFVKTRFKKKNYKKKVRKNNRIAV